MNAANSRYDLINPNVATGLSQDPLAQTTGISGDFCDLHLSYCFPLLLSLTYLIPGQGENPFQGRPIEKTGARQPTKYNKY